MRTKALFVAAATGLAAISTSFAQVYSVNVVGYVNVELQPGFNLVANPLSTTSNTIADLIPGVDGMSVFKYVDGAYESANYLELLGGWDDPTITLDPGEGAFISLPGDQNVTITFVGEVMEGQLSNPLPAGLSMKSSMVPQAGTLSALGYVAQDGDTVYKYSAAQQGYITANYLELLGGWDTGLEPTLEVGEAMFLSKAAASSWDRDFTVPRQ
jgi:hypothetical protein